jgi:hypothetical protein
MDGMDPIDPMDIQSDESIGSIGSSNGWNGLYNYNTYPMDKLIQLYKKCHPSDGRNGRVKAIALTFRPFLATFAIFHKWAKNSKKVSLYSLNFSSIFSDFCHFS